MSVLGSLVWDLVWTPNDISCIPPQWTPKITLWSNEWFSATPLPCTTLCVHEFFHVTELMRESGTSIPEVWSRQDFFFLKKPVQLIRNKNQIFRWLLIILTSHPSFLPSFLLLVCYRRWSVIWCDVLHWCSVYNLSARLLWSVEIAVSVCDCVCDCPPTHACVGDKFATWWPVRFFFPPLRTLCILRGSRVIPTPAFTLI